MIKVNQPISISAASELDLHILFVCDKFGEGLIIVVNKFNGTLFTIWTFYWESEMCFEKNRIEILLNCTVKIIRNLNM